MYFIRIIAIDAQILEVTYPSNILIEPVILSNTVRYVIGNNSVIKQFLDESCDIKDKIEITSPEYARRIIILADIMLYCNKLNINHGLILKYKDGVKIEQDETIIDSLEKPNARYEEVILFNAFTALAAGKEAASIAENAGILEGYNLLLTILEMGGI